MKEDVRVRISGACSGVSVRAAALDAMRAGTPVILLDDFDRENEADLIIAADNGSRYGTPFTVSIEAREGVTTGVSAADRLTTVRAAIAADARPQDLVHPGHVFPLRATPGGVLARAGHTEGSVDLAIMAGLAPAAVLCELMNPDGTMMRGEAIERFAELHDMPILTIAEMIAWRKQEGSITA